MHTNIFSSLAEFEPRAERGGMFLAHIAPFDSMQFYV
jgi:hypothetical protein